MWAIFVLVILLRIRKEASKILRELENYISFNKRLNIMAWRSEASQPYSFLGPGPFRISPTWSPTHSERRRFLKTGWRRAANPRDFHHRRRGDEGRSSTGVRGVICFSFSTGLSRLSSNPNIHNAQEQELGSGNQWRQHLHHTRSSRTSMDRGVKIYFQPIFNSANQRCYMNLDSHVLSN